ncbi:LytR C-terminal domain-containing protein [Demequina sp.]|uniref:LytR C-terminal domain-containing protein n=1 Tax=Demequina sp. TaxID=2050685 RepID=UPI003D0B6A7F
MSDQYAPDEFDEIAAHGGPVGVHRAPRPWWSRLVAPVLVFLIAGAVAYLIASYLWNQEVKDPEEPTPTITESVEETVTPSPTATPSPSVTPSPTPTETQSVQFDAKIAVLNGAGINGLAAEQQQVLEDAGFTKVTAANLSGSKPDDNVVVYSNEELKATAQEVAKALGIDDISLDVPQQDVDVEVHLVSDPSK